MSKHIEYDLYERLLNVGRHRAPVLRHREGADAQGREAAGTRRGAAVRRHVPRQRAASELRRVRQRRRVRPPTLYLFVFVCVCVFIVTTA